MHKLGRGVPALSDQWAPAARLGAGEPAPRLPGTGLTDQVMDPLDQSTLHCLLPTRSKRCQPALKRSLGGLLGRAEAAGGQVGRTEGGSRTGDQLDRQLRQLTSLKLSNGWDRLRQLGGGWL